MTPEERAYRRERIRAVREGLGLELLQDQMADRCELARTTYNKIENQKGNAATGTEALRGLARGWGVSMENAFDYLDGKIDLGDITVLREMAASGRTELAIAQAQVAQLLAEKRALEAARDELLGLLDSLDAKHGPVPAEVARDARRIFGAR
jgi:transcriptional regulator with XRE-family HTH domain